MRVLIATQGYFPAKAYGGPPVSIENFCNLMHLEMEIYIVTANHEHGCTEALEGIKNGWHKVGYAKVLYLSESQKNYKTFYKIIEKINPDWIYLNSLFDAPNVLPLLEIAYVKKIKVLLAPRGELCAGALKKKYKKIPYILYLRMRGWIKNVHFQSTSQEETNAIHKYLNVEENKIHYVTNIPSIPCKDYLRNKKKSGKGRFIFLSRIHPKKNLLSAISYFEKIY